MRDPYLYDDSDVLRNLFNIKSEAKLRQAEYIVTRQSIAKAYKLRLRVFNENTLCKIHKTIFSDLYEWAGKYRTIHMVKPEPILGGDTVRYATPDIIKSELSIAFDEVNKLEVVRGNPDVLIPMLVRFISKIWQIHPFREGNTRTTVVFAILLAKHLGIPLDKTIFERSSDFVRGALVWGSQGMYSNFSYLETIFTDALQIQKDVLHMNVKKVSNEKYRYINGYDVTKYKSINHKYVDYKPMKRY